MIGMRKPASCFLFLSAVLGSFTVRAQQAFVPTVIATPGSPSNTLYGTYGGALVRSSDLGNTWVPLYVTQAGLPQPKIIGFAVDPSLAGTVYLATTMAGGTLWKSADGGNTWTQANAGLPTTGSVDFFDLVNDSSGTFLYLKISGQLYRSSNSAGLWQHQGNLPVANATLMIAPSNRDDMYLIDNSTFQMFTSISEGAGWNATGTVLNGAAAQDTISASAVAYWNPTVLYLALNVPGIGVVSYQSKDGGVTWSDQTSIGLGPFTQILAANTGPTYALTAPINGTYISQDDGATWQQCCVTGLQHYGTTAVDPILRTTVYGIETMYPDPTPIALAMSTASGTVGTWTVVNSTITPSIGKPVAMYNITLEQGAPYSAPFVVQTAESNVWKTPVTISTSGEPWLQLSATSGSTPLPDSITITTTGLLPGVYNSTITISAPQTFNKSVSIPVILTVKPTGALGPGYMVSTIAGNGSPAGGSTSGAPTTVAIGGAKAIAVDPSNNIDFSAGSRIWQLSGGALSVLAGNGINASTGDGDTPTSASVADPDAIAFDSSANLYLPEFAPKRIREYSQGNIKTVLDMSRFNQPVGSHNVVIDPLRFMLLAMPQGIVRFNGSTMQTIYPVSFSNPYSMIEDASGNLWVSDIALNQIFEVTSSGTVSVIAGTGVPGFGGDNGPASQAMLNAPAGIAFDSQGTLYIADSGNNRIRTITSDGNIHTIAGSGLPGFAGDSSTADFASFMNPLGVAVDSKGNVYVADAGNNRVRMLAPQATPTPQISAVRGPNRANNLAPGGLFIIYGNQLAPAGYSNEVTTTTWPRSMGGVSVTINGVAAPLYYVSATQINGQIPFETVVGTATAIVATNGSLPAQTNFPVIASQPDVLVQNGGTQAIAVNQNGTVNSPTAPAHPGDIEVLYLSGIGIPNTPVATGAPSPSTPPLAQVNYPYQITLNGQPAPSSPYNFLGYAPGFPALEQANFQIPLGLTGDLSLVVTVNGVSSVPTILSVR